MLRKASFALLLILLAGSPVVAQQWAEKMFEVRRHDFGSVARGAKTEFEFVLSNIYLEDVHIASVRTSCGCTTPRIKQEWLKTYEKGAIVARFNTGSYRGNRAATVTVTFDKPFYARVQLHVNGYIRSDVEIQPGSVQLGSVDQGTAVDRSVTVTHYGRSNWQIVAVKSANPHITAEVVPSGRRGGRVSYQVKVHVDEDAPVGYLNDRLMLVTNDRQNTQIPLLVEGRVLAAITVSPTTLFMGVVEPGMTVTKRLVIRGRKPFRILSIDCDDESFEFALPPDATAKTVHVVPVTFVAGANTGKVIQTIRIETDLGQIAPELSAYAVVSAP